MNNFRTAYKHYLTYATDPVSEEVYLKLLQGTLPEKTDIMNAPIVELGFLRSIVRWVLQGLTVMLPERCGTLYVQGRKQKVHINEETGKIEGAPTDWGSTRKLWKDCPECAAKGQRIYHLNEHTNNVRYKILWSNRGMLVKHKLLYSLIFTRHNKRTASALFASGKEYHIKG